MSETGNRDDQYFNRADLTKEAVFADLYDHYAPKLLRHVMFRLNNNEEAKDIVSQIFFKTWQYLSQNNPAPRIKNSKAFLYQLANNLVIDVYRDKRKQTVPLPEYDSEAELASYSEIARGENKFMFEQVLRVINDLKEEHRQVISLRYLDEMSISEISQVLDKTKGAVSVLLFRAIKEVKKILKKKSF